MRKIALIVLLGALFSSVATVQAQDFQITLDPALDQAHKSALQDDVSRLQALDIRGQDIRFFSQVFGGDSVQDVARYLGERIHVILAPSFNPNQDLIPSPGIPDSGGDTGGDGRGVVVATNIGAAAFLIAVSKSLPSIGLRVGSDVMDVKSPRVGAVKIGERYVEAFPSIFRILSLVHEARHSDCTGGLSAEDKSRLHSGELPSDPSCTHVHVTCPEGNPLAGIPACDQAPWGAYAVELIFDVAVARACSNCSTSEQDVALAAFSETAVHILDLDGLVAGRWPAPDMTSTEVSLP